MSGMYWTRNRSKELHVVNSNEVEEQQEDRPRYCKVPCALLDALRGKIKSMQADLLAERRRNHQLKADIIKESQGLDLCKFDDLEIPLTDIPFAPPFEGASDLIPGERDTYNPSSDSEPEFESEGSAKIKQLFFPARAKRVLRVGKYKYSDRAFDPHNRTPLKSDIHQQLKSLERQYAVFVKETEKKWHIHRCRPEGATILRRSARRHQHTYASITRKKDLSNSSSSMLQPNIEIQESDATSTKNPEKSDSSSSSDSESDSDSEDNCTLSASDRRQRSHTDWHLKYPFEWNLFALSHQYFILKRIFTAPGVVVYEAISRGLDKKHVVIKVCDIHSSGKLPREMRLLKRAQSHRNIVRMHAWHVFQKTFTCAIVTEFLRDDGFPLCEIDDDKFKRPTYLKGDGFPNSVVDDTEMVQRTFMYDLVSAIQHLHFKGILYRDVKPSNMLWNSTNSHGTLIDFDIATLFQEERLHRSSVGTDGYTAPEMELITFSKRYGKALPFVGYGKEVDVYACGIVLGQMLFGFREDEVTDNDNEEAKGYAFLRRVWKLIQQEDKTCTRAHWLLVRMLHPLPSQRISIDDILSDPWFSSMGAAQS